MTELQDVSSGAKFVRADLHIHSFGDEGSYDVTDTTMTPENIVDIAVSKGAFKIVAWRLSCFFN